MKICIASDSHDRADALAQAVREAKALGAEAVIHCGDLIGAQTIKPTIALGLPLHLIHGNNVGDPQALHNLSRASGGLLQYHGADARVELAGWSRCRRALRTRGSAGGGCDPVTAAVATIGHRPAALLAQHGIGVVHDPPGAS